MDEGVFDAAKFSLADGEVTASAAFYTKEIGDKVVSGMMDFKNPENSYEITRTKQEIEEADRKLREMVKIGNWVSLCCALDYWQIKTDEEVSAILADWDAGWNLFETEKELIEKLGKCDD